MGRRMREVIAIALKRSAGDGTVFAGDPRDLALEITPRLTLQQGLTPEMVQTIVMLPCRNTLSKAALTMLDGITAPQSNTFSYAAEVAIGSMR